MGHTDYVHMDFSAVFCGDKEKSEQKGRKDYEDRNEYRKSKKKQRNSKQSS